MEINPWKLWHHLWVKEIIIFFTFIRGKTSEAEPRVLSGAGAGSRAVRAAGGSRGRAERPPGSAGFPPRSLPRRAPCARRPFRAKAYLAR